MTTTSLKLPESLKERVTAAVAELGISAHAFMIQAIEDSTSAAERRAEFLAQAESAREQMLQTGEGYDADCVHQYIRERLAGGKPSRPQPVKWRG